jgi:hypothetical protein
MATVKRMMARIGEGSAMFENDRDLNREEVRDLQSWVGRWRGGGGSW